MRDSTYESFTFQETARAHYTRLLPDNTEILQLFVHDFKPLHDGQVKRMASDAQNHSCKCGEIDGVFMNSSSS